MSENFFPNRKRLLLLGFLCLLALVFFLLQTVAYFGFVPLKEAVLRAGALREVSALPATGSLAPDYVSKKGKPTTSVPPVLIPNFKFSLLGENPVQEPPVPQDRIRRQTPPMESEISGVKRSFPCSTKKVALTFDDGPFLDLTPSYLKVLQEQGIHATFFLIGRHVQRTPGMVGLIVQQGHEIGNHAFSHGDLTQISLDTAKQELLMTAELLEQEAKGKINFFRPPGGKLNPALVEMVKDMGLQTVLWSIDPKDWQSKKTSNQLVNHILARVQPGSIVLLHEGKPHTLAALPLLIKELKQRGWQLVTLSELCKENEASQLPEQPDQSSEPFSVPYPLLEPSEQPAQPSESSPLQQSVPRSSNKEGSLAA